MFNVKTAGSSPTTLNEFQMKNFQNRREDEKMINTGNLRVYNTFSSVHHLLNSGEWMESYLQWMEIYEKKTREKQSEVQAHTLRSSSSSRGAYLKNLFRDKGRTNNLTIFEIT